MVRGIYFVLGRSLRAASFILLIFLHSLTLILTIIDLSHSVFALLTISNLGKEFKL